MGKGRWEREKERNALKSYTTAAVHGYCAVSPRASIYGNESVFQQQNKMEILGISQEKVMGRVYLGSRLHVRGLRSYSRIKIHMSS